jgi:DNA transposition AAA+ family ATPase
MHTNPEPENPMRNLEENSPAAPEPLAEAGILDPEAIRQRYLARGGTPELEVVTIVEFFRFAVSRGAASFAAAGKLIDLHESTVSKLARAAYDTSTTRICATIRAALKQVAMHVVRMDVPVVETSVFTNVCRLVSLIKATRLMGLLYGPSHAGKTTALKHCGRTMKRVHYWRMPAGGSTGRFVAGALAELGRSTRQSYKDGVQAILASLTPEDVVIVDQFHSTVVGRSLQTVTIDLTMEIHDETGCGMVLCGTDAIPKAFRDERLKSFLGQIANRCTKRMLIEGSMPEADLLLTWEAYGFAPLERGGKAHKKMLRLSAEQSYGTVCHLLQEARMLARGKKEAPGAEHFLSIVETTEECARGIMAGGAN